MRNGVFTEARIASLIAAHNDNPPETLGGECDGCHIDDLRAAERERSRLDAALTEIHQHAHLAFQRTGLSGLRWVTERAWRALAYPDHAAPEAAASGARAEAQVRAVEALIDPESTMSSGPMNFGPRYFSERDIRAALYESP